MFVIALRGLPSNVSRTTTPGSADGVAAGYQETCLWNERNGRTRSTMTRTRGTSKVPASSQTSFGLVRPPRTTVRSLMQGYLLTGALMVGFASDR